MDNTIDKQQIPSQNIFKKPKTKAYLRIVAKLNEDNEKFQLFIQHQKDLVKQENPLKTQISLLKKSKADLLQKKSNLKMGVYHQRIRIMVQNSNKTQQQIEDEEDLSEITTQILLNYAEGVLEDKVQKLTDKSANLFNNFVKVCQEIKSIDLQLEVCKNKQKTIDSQKSLNFRDSSNTISDKSSGDLVVNPGQNDLELATHENNIYGIPTNNTSNQNNQISDQELPTNNQI